MPVPFVRKGCFLWISMSCLEKCLSRVLLFIYVMKPSVNDCSWVKFVHEGNKRSLAPLVKVRSWSLRLSPCSRFRRVIRNRWRFGDVYIKNSASCNQIVAGAILYYMQMNNLTTCSSRRLNELRPKFIWMNLCFCGCAVRLKAESVRVWECNFVLTVCCAFLDHLCCTVV